VDEEDVNKERPNRDEDEAEVLTLGEDQHRCALPYRASINNAAESYFKKSTSLVYHYLDFDPPSVVLGDFNALEQITLFYGFCNRAGKAGQKRWNVNVRARGSTTNFSNHFQNHHTYYYGQGRDNVLDKAGATGEAVADGNVTNGPLQQWLSEKVRYLLNFLIHIAEILQTFKIETFY
jgi:hypothetical protein